MHNQISRREFAEVSAASFAAIALTSGGLMCSGAYAAGRPGPVQSRGAAVPARARILVACASRCGSTASIAEALGRDLRSRGYRPAVLPVSKVSDVRAYQAVLLGSAVRMGKWLPEAIAFVRTHQGEIRSVPNAFFTVHLRNLGDDEKSRAGRLAYLDPVHKLLRPDTEVFFAGRMDLRLLSFAERMLCKVMRAEPRDLRNWPAIHAWGSSVFDSGARS